MIAQIILILLDEKLQADGVDEFLELVPSQLTLLVAIELFKHRLELLVQLRVDQAASYIDGGHPVSLVLKN